MKSHAQASAPISRRERRAARRALHVRPPAPRLRIVESVRRVLLGSPMRAMTTGVLVLALVAIGVMQLSSSVSVTGPAVPGTRTAAGILVPVATRPAALVEGRAVGAATAPVHLIVWSDFQCPACRMFAQTIEPRLVADYVAGGQLQIEYRDLLVIGAESSTAAVASRCAERQGQFWPYHDVLFANQAAENSGALSTARLRDMADAVGMDRGNFDACLADGTLAGLVHAESAQGQVRGQSTPTLDFGSLVIAGSPPYAELKVKIDALLAAVAVTTK